MRRDRQVKRARLLQANTGAGVPAPAGQHAPKEHLERVDFGGPGGQTADFLCSASDRPASRGEGTGRDAGGGGKKEGEREEQGERNAGAGDGYKRKTEPVVSASAHAAGSLSHAQAGAVATAAAAAAAAAADAQPGRKTEGGERHVETQAFLTGVLAPTIQDKEGQGNQPATPIDVSATLAKLQDRRQSGPPHHYGGGEPLSPARYCPERDNAVAAGACGGRIADGEGGGRGEARSGAAPTDGVPHTRCHAAHAFSLGNPFVGFHAQQVDYGFRSDEGRREVPSVRCNSHGLVGDERSVDFSTAVAAAAPAVWAERSNFVGGCFASASSVGASSSEEHQRDYWHAGCFSSGWGSSWCSAAPSPSVVDVRGIAFGSGDEEMWRRDGWESVGTMAARGDSSTQAGDSSNGLLDSLRHFVASQVDPYRVGTSEGYRASSRALKQSKQDIHERVGGKGVGSRL